ncbi:MAG: NUDIX domain-containing protein [Patescibacteria group bacterium]
MEDQRPKVGMGVLIFKEGKILLGKRKGSHGEGHYSAPGGHLEYMESFEDCIVRETLEESGITIKNLKFIHVANVFSYAPKHYVNICLSAEWESGEPKVLEPEKCESWSWYGLDDLPDPLFIQTKLAIENYKSGNHFNNKVN